jgi:hypothetical protein
VLTATTSVTNSIPTTPRDGKELGFFHRRASTGVDVGGTVSAGCEGFQSHRWWGVLSNAIGGDWMDRWMVGSNVSINDTMFCWRRLDGQMCVCVCVCAYVPDRLDRESLPRPVAVDES